MRKMFSLMIISMTCFALTNGQVKNLQHAETLVVGSWETMEKFALISDLTKINLVVKDDHTAQLLPATMLDEKRTPIVAHWVVEKEGTEYYLELSSKDGMAMQKWIFHLDDGCLVQTGTSAKYLKLDNC